MQGTRPVVGHSPFIRELQPSPDTNRKKPQLQPSEPLVQGMNENRVNETESTSGVELSEKVSSGELGKGGVRVIASKEGLQHLGMKRDGLAHVFRTMTCPWSSIWRQNFVFK